MALSDLPRRDCDVRWWGKADLAYGRIGAFLFAPLIAHEVEFYAFACLVSG